MRDYSYSARAVEVTRLDKKRIAAAALKIIDRHGVSGFTIRSVADALGVTPMALYRHVKDKKELAALVIAAAATAVPVPVPTPLGDWREDLWAMAVWLRQSPLAQPSMQQLYLTYPEFPEELFRVVDRWIELWRHSGLDFQSAVFAAKITNMTINGLINQEAVLRTLDRPGEAMLARLPNLRVLTNSEFDPDRAFELVVRALIQGVHDSLIRVPLQNEAPARGKVKARRNR